MTALVGVPVPLEGGLRTNRQARRRHYLMCPPTHFAVSYTINPWMDPSIPVDAVRARAQWDVLVDSYRRHGHRVDLLEPVPGLPDLVYTANGAIVVDGRMLGARFANPQRRAEGASHEAWHRRHGDTYRAGPRQAPEAVNEGEGDFAVLSTRVLAGYGFRTSRAAHRELAALTGREVVSLELVDPRYYHLDVALTVLDDTADHIAYYPPAFSVQSRRLLAELFPNALIADDADARVLGLNCVSDGLHVFVPAGADHLMDLLTGEGYLPQAVDLSELRLGGGSVKCCTQEIRATPERDDPSTTRSPR